MKTINRHRPSLSRLAPLLARLKEKGIRIRAENGQLKIQAPGGQLEPALLQELKEKKAELLEFLLPGVDKPGHYAAVDPAEQKEYYPMSSAQKRLYILQQMNLTSTAYNLPQMIRLEGKVEIPRLEKTLKQLIARHENPRTSFHLLAAEPVQRILHHVEFQLENYKLQNTNYKQIPNHKLQITNQKERSSTAQYPDPKSQELRAKSYIHSFVRPFTLSQAPLLRVGLVKLGPLTYVLMVDMHHIISDRVSHRVLTGDFFSLFNGQALPALRLQYKDFCRWQQDQARRRLLKKQEEYWLGEFREEIPLLNLPTDWPRPLVRDFAGSVTAFEFNPDQSAALNRVARQEGVTLFMLLLALYSILLGKLSGQQEIIVGTTAANRRHADLEPIIGMFVNTLALRNDLPAQETFPTLLSRLKTKTINAFDNQEYPFEDLVEKTVRARDLDRNPLFDVMLEINHRETREKNEPGTGELPGLKAKPYHYTHRAAKFDLLLFATIGEERLALSVEYPTTLFKAATIARFIDYFRGIASTILRQRDIKLADIEILTGEEKQRLLYHLHDTDAVYPQHHTIHRCFAGQVEQTPDQVALIGQIPNKGGGQLSYKELNENADGLAFRLLEKGVKPDTIVGIMLEPCLEMITGLLAILKAGGAYMPIDPDYPQERIDFMMNDSSARVLLTAHEITSFAQRRTFNFPTSSLPHFSTSTPASLAYLIYTSGTTGTPKGVMIEHRNVVRLMKVDRFRFDFNRHDIWTLFHSFCFDFSVWEIYGALLFGGKLVIIPKMAARDTQVFLEILKKQQVTILNQTPSAFYHLTGLELKHPKKELQTRYIIFGGEALTPGRLKEWHARYPQVKLINMYGITETTVHVTFKEITSREIQSNRSSIGTPLPTLKTYIRDPQLKLLPMGTAGEITVAGAGLARGYLNHPGLTAEKFVTHPEIHGKRLYRSGDLALLPPDGNGQMEYLGRIDRQTKIRGYRIELGEIETQLLNHENITEAVVIASEQARGDRDKTLCAYFAADRELTLAELREYLANRLPAYMIPAYLMQIPRVPLTSSGKPDRKLLPPPAAASAAAYVPPGNNSEKTLTLLWADVLGIDHSGIGIDDNFFELGGHSLRAAILAAQIHKQFNVKFPLLELFRTPTIRETAEYIRLKAPAHHYRSIQPVEKREYYASSSAQKRLYILQQMDLDSTLYNVSQVIPLQTAAETGSETIAQTFLALIHRHETLRTSFPMLNGEVVQRVHGPGEFEFGLQRLAGPGAEPATAPAARGAPGRVGEAAVQARTKGIITGFIRPFALTRAPLLRVALLLIPGENSLLVVDLHHIICDGISYDILVREFYALYPGTGLPPLRLQYKDFSHWQNSPQQRQAVTHQETFWLNRFQGNLRAAGLPMDYHRPGEKDSRGDSLFLEADRPLTAQLKTLALETGTTHYIILAAAFTLLLAKYSGQEEVVVGSTVTGRPHADLQRIIGMLVNVLPLRVTAAHQLTFREFLNTVKKEVVDTLDNQDYAFDDLVTRLNRPRESWRNPLFDAVLDFRLRETPLTEEKPEQPQWYNPEKSIFDLVLAAVAMGSRLVIRFTYLTCLFKKSTIETMANRLLRLLAEVAAHPGQKISHLEILSSREKENLVQQVKNQKNLSSLTGPHTGPPSPEPEKLEVNFNF